MRKIWIDYLKVIAAFMVVSIHVSAGFYNAASEIDSATWWMANIINSFSRTCVPIFVMISGALLLGKDYKTGEFYFKRLGRLIPALIFWSLFYLCFRYFYENESFGSILWTVKAGALLSGQTYYHLWYLSMIILLMLFVPFMNAYIRGQKPDFKESAVFLGLICLFMFLNQLSSIGDIIFDKNFTWFKVLPYYMGYFVLGYFIQEHHEKIRVSNTTLLTTFFVFTGMGAYLNSFMVQEFALVKDNFILDNTGLFVFVMTVSIFTLFAKNQSFLPENKIIISLSYVSFGIYLLHPALLKIASTTLPGYNDNGLLYIPLMCVAIFGVSYGAARLMMRSRLLRKVC